MKDPIFPDFISSDFELQLARFWCLNLPFRRFIYFKMSQLPHVLSSQDESLDLEKVSTAHKEELNTKEPHSQANSLDWDGPEDTDNPKTWSLKKRIFHSVIPGLFNFVV